MTYIRGPRSGSAGIRSPFEGTNGLEGFGGNIEGWGIEGFGGIPINTPDETGV